MLLYGFMEGTAYLGYRALFCESFSFSHMKNLREGVVAAQTVETKQSGQTPTYLRHPYYGYILNPRWYAEFKQLHGKDSDQLIVDDPINAYGFFGTTPPVQARDPKKFVVAVTGGSVSAYAASLGRETFINGFSQIPALKGREIVLLDLGGFAYKEPQQVMVVADILSQGGHIDLLINIDGFNEIALPRAHDAFSSGVSPYFPQAWRLTSETNFSRGDMMNLGRIALVQEQRLKLAKIARAFPFRYSVTANAAWWIIDNRLVKKKNALEQGLGRNATQGADGLVPTTTDQLTSLGPPQQLKDARALYEASASLWARDSVMLNNMVASQGGLYIHLLQPNQYFPGSRPPGADSAQVKQAVSPYKPEVEQGYPYLRSAGKALVQSGIHFYDLTALFQNDADPVYIDSCCHFTKDGNVKLVKAIVSRAADAISENMKPQPSVFTDADYRVDTLRALAFQPESYVDGSGEALKQPAAAAGQQDKLP